VQLLAPPLKIHEVLEGEGLADWIMENEVEYALASEVSETEAIEPCFLAEAMQWLDWLLWGKAIFEELETLCCVGTWELVDTPENANVIGSKWVFQAKKDVEGNVVRYKV
jgi:hypothetical protein